MTVSLPAFHVLAGIRPYRSRIMALPLTQFVCIVLDPFQDAIGSARFHRAHVHDGFDSLREPCARFCILAQFEL